MLQANNILTFPEFARPAFNPDRLKEARLEKGWNQSELARAIGVSPETISNLESGDNQPGGETLDGLCQHLGYSAGYFALPDGEGGKLESPIFFRSYTTKTKRQHNCLNVWRKRAGRMLHLIGKFVDLPPVRLPKAVWTAYDDPAALAERSEELAQQCRRLWGIGDGPIGNLTRLLESMGVCIIRLDLEDMVGVDGFSCWQDGRPMIFILAQKSAARERLDLAHEVLHLIAHQEIPEETIDDKACLKVREKQAFAFGGALLAPRNSWGREVMSFTVNHFTQLKRRWGFSIAGQASRCLLLGVMDEDRFVQLRKNLSGSKQLTVEPLDETTPCESPIMMRQAIEILKENNVLTGWQFAGKFLYPPAKMAKLTTLPEEYFLSPKEPTPVLNLSA